MKTIQSLVGLLTAMLCLFTINLSAQDGPPVGPTTTIEFEKTTYDFGDVEEGVRVTQVYTFTNTGDEPLIFSNARGSCGCTVPQWPREPIAPGETASITVEFNTKNKKGKRNQKVTLTGNTNPPQTFIYLTGNVILEEGEEITVSGEEDEEAEEAEKTTNTDCFAIFPNPTAEMLKVQVKEENLGQSAIISIFSQSGQVMAKREIAAVESMVEFSVSHYPAGTYIANVQIGEQKPESMCFVVMD